MTGAFSFVGDKVASEGKRVINTSFSSWDDYRGNSIKESLINIVESASSEVNSILSSCNDRPSGFENALSLARSV